ncbi:uncharacterized protein LOC132556112 [Ylistrum balloti]|uniref:uncharacterized protein LOC132556112 n=1 Tax=Ylistrum balloti TaxID=509963 RepID=UPI002905F63E|nr:uncharacterized protein LOC132556112 [Ylistrum balloti]
MLRQSPPALVISKEEDVVSHGYVMYGLVKPGKDGKCVESAAAMVNVIPRKRIYRMATLDELDTFRSELLKRPLVIQPVIEAGSGIQKLNCFFRVRKEKWVMMLNQNHSKIMGRIMMGIDTAKTIMKRGEPFILEFMLSNVVKRLYYSSMANKAPSSFQYIDCHHGDLIIRGSGDSFHQGMKWEVKAQHMQFDFDDITDSDIMVRTLKEAAFERQSPLIQVIPDGILREILPGWTFEQAEEEEEEMEEEEEYAFQLEGSQGTSVSNNQPAAPQRGRVRGRSNRGTAAASNYEVSVELHAPLDEKEEPQWNSNAAAHQQHQTDSSQYTNLTNERTNHVYEDARLPRNVANHHYQGSGRSGSSAADSGYEGENDAGGFEDRKYGRLLQGKGNNDYRQGRDYTANGQIRGYTDNGQRGGYPNSVQNSGNPDNRQDSGFPDNRQYPAYGQNRSYPDNRQASGNSDRNKLLSNDRYNYDNPAFTNNDNYSIVEQSVEHNKAAAARMLGNHARGPTDHRHRTGYLPPSNMPTISQSIDTQDGHMGESAI